MKVGLDDLIVATQATREALEQLPRAEILPPLIHLVDIERTEHVGHLVRTDIVIAGVGETFHVPRSWELKCREAECEHCPTTISLGPSKELLALCRKSDDQLLGAMRKFSHCANSPRTRVLTRATVTEILGLPAASPTVTGPARDYREKIVAYLGALSSSSIRYRASGEVIAEPTRQRASLLITELDRLQSAADHFVLTPNLREQFLAFQIRPSTAEDAVKVSGSHVDHLVHGWTRLITKIYGRHRETVLLGELLVYHSLAEVPWGGETIKGVLDGLVMGDTGQGKTTLYRRLSDAVHLGHFASGSTSSRAGVLYSLDSKVNDKRILRWGAFPLAHGELVAVDEAQNIPREQWREFTTARSEGVLKVERSIRAEHPSRVRLLCFANPPGGRAMSEYQYGIVAVHPEYGFLDPQDLRRFDFVVCVAAGDQSADEVVTQPHGWDESSVSAELLRESILWAWTRRIEHCRYASGAEDAIRDVARSLNTIFGTPEIPLLITDAHEKVARLAFAFASLLHSTDEAHELVIVTPVHVRLAIRFLLAIYTHPNCAFDQYAAVLRYRGTLADREYLAIKADLLTAGSNREDVTATEALLELFLTEDDLPRPDLEAATGLGKDALTRRIGKLRKHRLILSGRRGYRKTAKFVAFLRRWVAERGRDTNRSNPNPKIGLESNDD